MGGCQNHGPFLGTLNLRCRIIIGNQKGTIILTTTHMDKELKISSSTPKHSLFTGHIAACILTLHCRNLDPETQNAGNAEHKMQQVLN